MAWAPAAELAWRAPSRSCAPTWHERSSCWVAPRSRSWGRLTSRSRPIGGSIHAEGPPRAPSRAPPTAIGVKSAARASDVSKDAVCRPSHPRPTDERAYPGRGGVPYRAAGRNVPRSPASKDRHGAEGDRGIRRRGAGHGVRVDLWLPLRRPAAKHPSGRSGRRAPAPRFRGRYQPLHPAVLRLIESVVEGARSAGRQLASIALELGSAAEVESLLNEHRRAPSGRAATDSPPGIQP